MALAHRAKVKDPAKAFISTWRTSIVYTGSTANNQIKLPLEVAGTYKFTVQWGDGTSNLITTWNQAETTHTYPAPGDYTVTITGFIKGWDFGGGTGTVAPTTGDMRKLLTITQFGCLRLVAHPDPFPVVAPFWGTFYGCTNLNLSNVTDMPNFKGTNSTHGFLRGCLAVTTINNINKWDVSKIQVFRNMLREMPLFNQNIGNWNTGNGVSFFGLLNGSNTVAPYGTFNNGGSDSIKNWNMSNAVNLSQMFLTQPLFNQPIGLWDISNVTNLAFMFYNVNGTSGIFNQDLSNWNTGKVTNMNSLFWNAGSFNQNIGSWDVSNVTDMGYMFGHYPPSQGTFNNGGSDSIKNWNTSKVTTMNSMFQKQPFFNQPIGNWDTSNVTNMAFMFFASQNGVLTFGTFNQNIGSWNTSKVTTMNSMFYKQTSFDQNLGSWNTANVTNMLATFDCTDGIGVFNNGGSDSIKNWNTSKVTTFNYLFRAQSLFNQPIGSWDVSKVTDIANMFRECTAFNQPLNNWNISLVTAATNFMLSKTFNDYSAANYDSLLIGWASRPVKPNISINFGTIKRTAASTAARAILTSAPNNWTIVDGGI